MTAGRLTVRRVPAPRRGDFGVPGWRPVAGARCRARAAPERLRVLHGFRDELAPGRPRLPRGRPLPTARRREGAGAAQGGGVAGR